MSRVSLSCRCRTRLIDPLIGERCPESASWWRQRKCLRSAVSTVVANLPIALESVTRGSQASAVFGRLGEATSDEMKRPTPCVHIVDENTDAGVTRLTFRGFIMATLGE